MASIVAGHFPGLDVLDGDVAEPNFGICWDQPPLSGRIDTVWHAAGDTRFSKGLAAEVMRANVRGTENALTVARILGARQFHHISTAYVCGEGAASASESLSVAYGRPRNPYEESKQIAEQLVVEWGESTGIPWTILRPPIIAGNSVDGFACSFTGYYGYMLAWTRLRDSLIRELEDADRARVLSRSGIQMANGVLHLPIHVPGNAQAPLSIVPVDYVIDSMWAVHTSEQRNCSFHLCGAAPKSFGWWLSNSLRELRIAGVTIGRRESNTGISRDLLRWERHCKRACKEYLPYISDEPTFLNSNTRACLEAEPSIDERYLSRILTFATECGFEASRAQHSPKNVT